MRVLRLIKSLLALSMLLAGSSALASIYSSYSPLTHLKPLSIIVSVTLILGLLSFFQKNNI
ncbi:MAG TPA: hypothetical protein EYG05_01040 [Candidatus Thioglobus autotrophicus]|jgi:ABC-type Mn2+/Zn2+ transport system permease subunit|nr:MAG: hypothetical protein DSZ13_03400 [Candidatus Thioglobus sp.]RUM79366.1 MAG: hypothetical protein DSZ14_03945 [Candidatus Thioglobus sp.]RUM82189.1 MAG: hypothetical protein DSZ18_05155 [Candidatus Thioglobus sp.]RUM82328.1 MAG: hypothetical protein DSZ16_02565 [Candidatus Thioglobus sp.]HIL03041.1 hypothetical protein [Candidatus Thioglobus autotrophicus]